MNTLILADQWLGWSATYWLMAALMGVGMVATWYVVAVRHVYEDTPTTSAALPTPEVP